MAHGGFAAAGRALREPKSKLSRRVAAIEARLGLGLIERSSRRFRVTEIGQGFYERCRAMMLEAERAEALVAEAQAEPHGRICMSCPTGLIDAVAPLLRGFLVRFPQVTLQVVASDRPVDLIEERIDVALRVRHELNSDAALTVRSLGTSRWILVASPGISARTGGDIAGLASVPALGTCDAPGETSWRFEGTEGAAHTLTHEPRLTCGDFASLREAATEGLGVAYLPDHACAGHLASGRLVHILPAWRSRAGLVHLVFTTRRGLPPAMRALIDRLAGFPKL